MSKTNLFSINYTASGCVCFRYKAIENKYNGYIVFSLQRKRHGSLPLTSCMASGKMVHLAMLSVPPHHSDGDATGCYLIPLRQGIGTMNVEYLM